MDELEMRLAAIELVIIELGAWLPADALADAQRSIEAGLPGCCAEEKAVRCAAIELLRDARGRFGGLSG